MESAICCIYLQILSFFSVCSQLENDVIGIIGVCEKCALATIQSYSDTFQVPFLLISSAPIPDDVTSDSFQFFLTPVFIQGLLDIVIYKQWHRVFYIYDTDEGFAKLYEFYLFFTNVFVNFIGLQKLLFNFNFIIDFLNKGYILGFILSGLLRLQHILNIINAQKSPQLDIIFLRIPNAQSCYEKILQFYKHDDSELRILLDLPFKKVQRTIELLVLLTY